MKKQRNIILSLFLIPFIVIVLTSCSTGNRVIKQTTDERGLTSVVFTTSHNDTFALDYLTRREYKRLFKQPVIVHHYAITCSNDTIFYNK